MPKKTKPLVALAESLPAETPTSPQPPPLEAEQPHRALAKANALHAKLTQELRELKGEWAAKNIKAQQCRQPIPTPEITHVERRRRELHLALEAAQAEIGRLNRLIREHKATRQAANGARTEKTSSQSKKNCPLKSHPQWDCYFRLAAENALAPALLKQIEADAKSLLAHALETGVDT